MLYVKNCSFPSSFALTPLCQDQPDGLCGRKIQAPMCQWWILCQPKLKQKSIFEADLPVVNTYCAFPSIIEELQFEWPKLLSEETKPEDLLWICTKHSPILNNDDWNPDLSSAPWRSLVWIERTPWRSPGHLALGAAASKHLLCAHVVRAGAKNARAVGLWMTLCGPFTWEMDSVILVGPFQLRQFCDKVPHGN